MLVPGHLCLSLGSPRANIEHRSLGAESVLPPVQSVSHTSRSEQEACAQGAAPFPRVGQPVRVTPGPLCPPGLACRSTPTPIASRCVSLAVLYFLLLLLFLISMYSASAKLQQHAYLRCARTC